MRTSHAYCFFFFNKGIQLVPHWRKKPTELGSVVQSIVSLTSSLRGHLVKCFTTL